MRRHRSRIGQALMESLEPRQLFSMTAKIPDLSLLQDTPRITVIDEPVSPGNSFTVAANVPFTRVLVTLPDDPSLELLEEIDNPGDNALIAFIQWGDGTSSTATLRRNAAHDIEVVGTHTYAATGNFPVLVEVWKQPSIPPGYDGPPVGVLTVIHPVAKFDLQAQVAEVVALDSATKRPADLTVLPVKTSVVVGETTGGVLAVISHQGFRLAGEDAPGTPIYAVINWGDGTYEAATLTRAGADILVTGHHAYTRPGDFHAIVTLVPYSPNNDPLALVAPPTDISNTRFNVSLNSVTGQTLKVRSGNAFSGTVARIDNFGAFPDTDQSGAWVLSRNASGAHPAATIKATVVWGDGSVSPALLRSNRSGGFDVIASHTYPGAGTYRTQVLIDVAYSTGPFAQRLRTINGLALVGDVPGNVPFLPQLTFPLANFAQQIGIRGELRTGIVAIGGETTGYEVRGADFTYELEFASPALKAKADQLSGQAVAVGGVLTIRPGVEIGQRRILTVSVLDHV